MKPGYYHFSAAMSPDGGKSVGIFIVHNQRDDPFARLVTEFQQQKQFKNILSATDSLSANVEMTLKLELYDMVDIKKTQDSKAGWDKKNYFEGWLMS